jgi:serine/threonine protein kinase
VFLVRSRITGQYFALKQIEKKYISDYKKFEQILREKKILTELKENRHTIKFHCSFESLNHLNFLIDFYPGGELFCHLTSNRLREADAKVYFCEILIGL